MASYTEMSPCGWYLPNTSPTTVADFLSSVVSSFFDIYLKGYDLLVSLVLVIGLGCDSRGGVAVDYGELGLRRGASTQALSHSSDKLRELSAGVCNLRGGSRLRT